VSSATSIAAPAVAAELRLTRNWRQRAGVAVLFAAAVGLPLLVSSGFWISVLSFAGIAAVAAVGLNLLTGYAGELSIGHSFFVAVGAYSAVFFGGKHGQTLIVWLLAVAVTGAAAGALLAPVALRIRGVYFVVVTIGLVFFGIYVFNNWSSLTGGPGGITAVVPLSVGPLDFRQLSLGGHTFTREQSLCVLIWLLVALAMLVVKNISRSRAGRAMQATRDNDLAAEVVGISLFRVKAGAFIVSSAIAAVAGGLLAAEIQYVIPEQFSLELSLQYLSILIVGGLGSTYGPVIGALVVGGLPELLNRFGGSLPLVKANTAIADAGWGLSTAQFTVFSYGMLLVLFLLIEPRGLAALLERLFGSAAKLGAHGRFPPTLRSLRRRR
jgi:branched-chain amino acid transport system permease protein